ncbi:MAG: hypothetical protein KDD37_06885 [Bdellovibrionales bacterium]|nr:hypothetical protein [Bdellovibrionales bacterium]
MGYLNVMRIEYATAKDDALLKYFFEQEIINGAIDYKVLRPAGFFAHSAQNYDETSVLKLTNEQNEIHGLVSINTRDALISEWSRLGWITDLRLSSNRKAIVYWFENFLEEIQKIKTEKHLDHLFTFINKTNIGTLNAFIRPRNLRPNLPRFHLISNFYRTSIFCKVPSLTIPLQSVRIRSLDMNNIEALANYLQKKKEGRLLAYRYSATLLKERLERWHNFTEENFLIAYDSKGNIVGCAAPWNAKETQQYHIVSYSDFYQSMQALLKIPSSMGLTKNLPSAGSTADFYFLTHLAADNPYIFHRLLSESLEFCKPEQYIIYSSFEGDHMMRPPKDFIHIKQKFGLYLVLNPEDNLPFSHLSQHLLPDFEVAFL